jgi:hypothetical protein
MPVKGMHRCQRNEGNNTRSTLAKTAVQCWPGHRCNKYNNISAVESQMHLYGVIVAIMPPWRRLFFLTPLHPLTRRNLGPSHYDDVTSNLNPYYTFIVVFFVVVAKSLVEFCLPLLLCCHYCLVVSVAPHAPQK